MESGDLPRVDDVPINSTGYRKHLLDSWGLLERLAHEHGEMAYTILESMTLAEFEEFENAPEQSDIVKKVDEFDEIGRQIQDTAKAFLAAMEEAGIDPALYSNYSRN